MEQQTYFYAWGRRSGVNERDSAVALTEEDARRRLSHGMYPLDYIHVIEKPISEAPPEVLGMLGLPA